MYELRIMLRSAQNARNSSLPSFCSEYISEISEYLFETASWRLNLTQLTAACLACWLQAEQKKSGQQWLRAVLGLVLRPPAVLIGETACPKSGWRESGRSQLLPDLKWKKLKFKASVKISDFLFLPLMIFRIFYVNTKNTLYSLFILFLEGYNNFYFKVLHSTWVHLKI